MTAFIFSLISTISPFLVRRTLAASVIPVSPPPPPALHVSLDDSFLSKFSEVIVIGDVHGCFDEMKIFLDTIHNGTKNAESILKIFVGDLVNKGPKNREVLQYLLEDKNKQSPSCLAVRGNHDELVLREYLTWKKHPKSLKKKNEWMKALTQNEIDYLTSLPYTISIPSLNSIIVHAGIVPGVSLQDQNPDDLVTMRNLIEDPSQKSGYSATKKHHPGTAWAKVWSGPEHVYFGHDAKRRLQVRKFATGLDTGCIYGDTLTGLFIKGPRKGEFVKVQATKCHQPVGEE